MSTGDQPTDTRITAESVPAHTLALRVLGGVADRAAGALVLREYRSRQRPNTVRRHDSDLITFADFLATVGVVIPVDDREVPILASDPQAWAGMTAGMVMAFRTWMLTEGYAIGSVNVRLSTVRTYARLAHLAGVLGAETWSRIRQVGGYRVSEGDGINQTRAAAATPTRVSSKKAAAHVLPPETIRDLKQAVRTNPAAPSPLTSARDYVMLCLLVDLGLRCGEVALLRWQDVVGSMLQVTRPKVQQQQRHHLIGDSLPALEAYQALMPAPDDLALPLLAAVDKHGTLRGYGMGERAIHQRIARLGTLVGLPNLSPHDLRHSWATRLAQQQVPIQNLRDAGGWSNFATPARYIARQAIANAGIQLAADQEEPED